MRRHFHLEHACVLVLQHQVMSRFRRQLQGFALRRQGGTQAEQNGDQSKFSHQNILSTCIRQPYSFQASRIAPIAISPPMAPPIQKFCQKVLVVRMMRRSLDSTKMDSRIGTVSAPARICDQ